LNERARRCSVLLKVGGLIPGAGHDALPSGVTLWKVVLLLLAGLFSLLGRLPGLPRFLLSATVTRHRMYSKFVFHLTGPRDRAMMFHGTHCSETMVDAS
jgi:hypothetical protein